MREVTRSRRPLTEAFINGRFFNARVTGVQRYARETIRCLDELLANEDCREVRWTLLVPRGTHVPSFRKIAVEQLGCFTGHLWEQFELPWRARRGLLFSFGMTGPAVKRLQIVTVHDANVVRIPHAFNWWFRVWYKFLVRWLVARSPLTIAVSRFSANEAAECYGAVPNRLRVSTEGWQHLNRVRPDESVLDQYGLKGKPFALAVSSPTPNKNFDLIRRAIALLGHEAPCCVVVGAADESIFNTIEQHSSAIVWLGYISDEKLKALYQAASCFIFPSFYEGFGIPPLEAMACGCPVLASTATAVKEVCGDAPLYFDPREPRELADRLREVFADPVLRAGMSLAGRERARHFSWAESAQLNWGFIQEALCGA